MERDNSDSSDSYPERIRTRNGDHSRTRIRLHSLLARNILRHNILADDSTKGRIRIQAGQT